MKKLLLPFLLIYGIANAQVFTPIHNAQAPDYIAAIKYFGIPYGDIPTLNGTSRLLPGALFYATMDSSIYSWTGTQWLKVTTGIGGGSGGIDSATFHDNNLCFWDEGGSTCFDLSNPVCFSQVSADRRRQVFYNCNGDSLYQNIYPITWVGVLDPLTRTANAAEDSVVFGIRRAWFDSLYGGGGGGGAETLDQVLANGSSLTTGRAIDLAGNSFSISDGVGTTLGFSPADGAIYFSTPLGKEVSLSDDNGNVRLLYDGSNYLTVKSEGTRITGALINNADTSTAPFNIVTIDENNQLRRAALPTGGSGTLQQAFDGSVAASDNPVISTGLHSLTIKDLSGGTSFDFIPNDGHIKLTTTSGKYIRVADDDNDISLHYDNDYNLKVENGGTTVTGPMFNNADSSTTPVNLVTIDPSTNQLKRAEYPFAFNTVSQYTDSSFTLHKQNGDSTTITFEGGLDAANLPHQYLNGYKLFVDLNTDSITQGTTNKWFTNALARAAISLTTTGSGAATYNNTTGVLNVPTPGASTGTVSNFSANDLAPLFTTTEATTTTTPVLSFALSNAAASTVFGRFSSTGAPSFITALDSSFLAANFHTEPYYDGRYWKRTGNNSTDTATMFVGNTDNKRLNFRVNNNPAGQIDSSSMNTFYGYRAGAVVRPAGYLVNGMKNTAFGFEALTADTTGYSNIGIGVRAGKSITSGAGNIIIGELAGSAITTGSFHIAIGQDALSHVTTSSYNIAMGYKAGEATTSATNNVAIGYTSMQALTSGSNSTAIGYRAMQGNNGSNSTAVGAYSQGNTAGGSDNTSFGYGTLYNATGNNNTAIGENAGINNTTGAANTYVGTNSGNGIQGGSNNTVIGANTTGLTSSLTNNVIIADGSGNKRIWAGSTGVVSLFAGAAVASASAIAPTGNIFHVTGTTPITSITATNINAGAMITIIFDGALTFTDGSNLKLNGNFSTAADATITMIYDGTNFYETSRSTN